MRAAVQAVRKCDAARVVPFAGRRDGPHDVAILLRGGPLVREFCADFGRGSEEIARPDHKWGALARLVGSFEWVRDSKLVASREFRSSSTGVYSSSFF